jgi:hypothetical protein
MTVLSTARATGRGAARHRLVLLLVAGALFSCGRRRVVQSTVFSPHIPAFYTSQEIRVTVVDEESGRPVPDVAVLAIWRDINSISEGWEGYFRTYEMVTDAAGTFVVPRWGPRSPHVDAYLDVRDPELWLLRRGYLLGYADNAGALDAHVFATAMPVVAGKEPPNGSVRLRRGQFSRPADHGSVWNGRTLRLRRAHNVTELARALAAANPTKPYNPAMTRFPQFAAEWQRSWEDLPPELRASVHAPE